MSDKKFYWCLATFVAGFLAACVALLWWDAGEKARAFERVTGKHVEQRDALFLELKVQEAVK
jgi:hypothetical protein